MDVEMSSLFAIHRQDSKPGVTLAPFIIADAEVFIIGGGSVTLIAMSFPFVD
jgi:hypothetical protein